MKIAINLASRPFVELRPLFARLRLAMAVLALVAVGLGIGLHSLNLRAKAATAQMDELKQRTAVLEQERETNEARMRQPQNMAVLERSQFLNALFARKSFSWTGVMMDLEHVLPSGVQVTSIEPGISKEGDVSIRLRVTGDRDRAIQLVRNLERSQRFIGPRLGGESALTAEKAKALGAQSGATLQTVDQVIGNGVEFEIFSGYNPLPETSAGKREEGRGKSQNGIGKTGLRAQGSGVSKTGVRGQGSGVTKAGAKSNAKRALKKAPAAMAPTVKPAARGGVR